MTNDVKIKLEEFSLGIISALKAGIRPSSLQYSHSQVGIGDFCAFAGSAINYLVSNGVLSVEEKRESATSMVNIFMRTFGHHATLAELSEIADIVLEQNGVENNFGGIVAAIKFAH